LTGFLCLAGLGWAYSEPQRRSWIPFLLLGAMGGILGSLLSGSRGGWVGMPLIFLVLYRAYGSFMSTRLKALGAFLLVGAAALVYVVPQFGVQQRVNLAISDMQHYKEGNSVTSV